MNEPQVWTLIGVFGTALFAMLTLVSGMFVRLMRAEFGTVRAEMRGEFASVRSEIGALRAEMQGEFASVRTEIRYLDRDVQVLSKRVFGDDAA